MRKAFSILLLLLLISSLYAASVFSECSAVPQTDKVKISWITKSETGIKQFAILRSNDDVNFIELKKLNPKGPGTSYEYVDENVMFKDASRLFYKVRALGESGQLIDESSMLVLPNTTGMFRTWGAIKALFR